MTLAERLCYITTKIHTEAPHPTDSSLQIISDATGFFISFKYDTGEKLCLVTNRHVIEGKSKVFFYLNSKSPDGKPVDRDFCAVAVDITGWKEGNNFYFHPLNDPTTGKPYDLCIIPFDAILPQLEAAIGKQLYYESFSEDVFMTDANKQSLDVIEDIIMVGYPCGLWDSINNRPIIRKGITATDPKTDYQNSKQFLIDCACIQGSSGSPVLQYKGGLKAKVEDHALNLSSEVEYMLLGIQQSIPEKPVEAVIDSSSGTTTTLTTGEKVSISIPINLGYILKSELLLDFKAII